MVKSTIRNPYPLLATLLLSAAAVPLGFAQATVRLEMNTNEVYVNEPFVVTVRVEDFEQCGSPAFPQIANCSVRALQGGMDSSQTLIVNGRMTVTRSRTYQFELTALAEGELVIPPVKMKVDERTLATEPVRLGVGPSDADELLAVEISCDRQRVYVGQRVRLTMTIWIKPFRWQRQLLGARDMMRFIRPVSFGPFPTREIKTDRRRLKDADGSEQTFYTYSTWTDYVPDRPGRLSFDDVQVGMQYPTGLSKDIFGVPEVTAYRSLLARPKVLEIEVIPLPANGRPANFTGAVGTYQLVVTAQPTFVRVGDPIELTLAIRGDGPIESLPPPDLTADPRLTDGFRIPDEQLAGEAVGSRKIFTQTIRAERIDLREIPAVEYPYFDPDRELYVIALSEPIPLRVAPAAELDTSSLVDVAAPAANQTAVQLRRLDGLHGNETRETELLRATTSPGFGSLALATFAPPAAYLLLWGWGAYVQSRGPGLRRRQRALRTARRRIEQARHLPPPQSAAEVAAAMADYLADRFDQPAARLLGRAALEFLADRGAPSEMLHRWREVMTRCEQASFAAGTDGDTAALADEARACLQALERERL